MQATSRSSVHQCNNASCFALIARSYKYVLLSYSFFYITVKMCVLTSFCFMHLCVCVQVSQEFTFFRKPKSKQAERAWNAEILAHVIVQLTGSAVPCYNSCAHHGTSSRWLRRSCLLSLSGRSGLRASLPRAPREWNMGVVSLFMF